MEKITVFSNEHFGELRTVEIDNNVWFVGKDVAEALGYIETAQAIRKHIDDDDKGVVEMNTPGGTQNVTIINESGLYSLVLSSKLESAKKFKRWVTSEVLPSIRKHGMYATPQTVEDMIADPDYAIKLLTNIKEERAKRIEAQKKLEAAKPKIVFADAVSASDTTILISDLAKLIKQNGYDIGQKRMYIWLRKNGYLVNRKGVDWNSPTQRSMEMGLFKIRENVIYKPNGDVLVKKTTRVTGKGQAYFVNKFLQAE